MKKEALNLIREKSIEAAKKGNYRSYCMIPCVYHDMIADLMVEFAKQSMKKEIIMKKSNIKFKTGDHEV